MQKSQMIQGESVKMDRISSRFSIEVYYAKVWEVWSYDNLYEYKISIYDVPTDYTEYRHVQIILCRSGLNIRVHFMVAHINN